MQIAPWVFPLTEETASIPPHVRGKAFLNTGTSSAPGITPACAGKRRLRRGSCPPTQDHPRVCGEKRRLTSEVSATPGSPPRVRGKGAFASRRRVRLRITPACAGKRQICGICGKPVEDHPRVCGEKAWFSLMAPSPMGSPPRVRGKGQRHIQIAACKGITPACAGKRFYNICGNFLTGDHPRVCGEKGGDRRHRCNTKGSPPRVRGKGSLNRFHNRLIGITPACAGKRKQRPLGYSRREDHPRVCGEKKLWNC